MSAPSFPLPSHPLVRLPAPAVVFVGLWLIISPWFLPGGYPPAARWVHVSAGILAMLLGSAKLLRPLQGWLDLTLIALALWLLYSPWIAAYAGYPTPKYNAAICATVIVLFSGWGMIAAIAAKGLRG